MKDWINYNNSGELACGNIKNRKEIISLLQTLPQAHVAENDEIQLTIKTSKEKELKDNLEKFLSRVNNGVFKKIYSIYKT